MDVVGSTLYVRCALVLLFSGTRINSNIFPLEICFSCHLGMLRPWTYRDVRANRIYLAGHLGISLFFGGFYMEPGLVVYNDYWRTADPRKWGKSRRNRATKWDYTKF